MNPQLEQRVNELVCDFDHFLSFFEHECFARGFGGYASHRWTISRLKQLGSIRTALYDKEYLVSLRDTLVSWSMQRTDLIKGAEFEQKLNNLWREVAPFRRYTLRTAPNGAEEKLWKVVSNLNLNNKTIKIVVGSKTLTHLLPNWVVPIDRKYTCKFLGISLTKANQRKIHALAYEMFSKIAHCITLDSYVGSHFWHTGPAKVLDNAIAGYILAQNPKIVLNNAK